jgi:competence protein ComEC
MRRLSFLAVMAVACSLIIPSNLRGETKPLQIYFVDVEGGQATLIIAPSGASLLIDTGWPGFNGRDADRITAAAKAAGLEKIDYLIITHCHTDHVGGVAQLAERMKIGTFVDHGPNMEDSDSTRQGYAGYEKVIAGGKHLVVKPGDTLPVKGLKVQVLTAAGEAISKPLHGAWQANPLCASEPNAPVDSTENARSVGTLITYGRFRFIDLGDLTKRKERDLVCPNNLVGAVDLYLTTHHGLDLSNSKAIVDALHPRVAIMNNGARKGGIPAAWQIVHDSPGLADMWQLHYALAADKAHNVSEEFIANLEENCEGKYIKVTAQKDGSFTVLNSRNNFKKDYPKVQ